MVPDLCAKFCTIYGFGIETEEQQQRKNKLFNISYVPHANFVSDIATLWWWKMWIILRFFKCMAWDLRHPYIPSTTVLGDTTHISWLANHLCQYIWLPMCCADVCENNNQGYSHKYSCFILSVRRSALCVLCAQALTTIIWNVLYPMCVCNLQSPIKGQNARSHSVHCSVKTARCTRIFFVLQGNKCCMKWHA